MHNTLTRNPKSRFRKIISILISGSGIPEVKVIMHGFVLKNYLSAKTLLAKVRDLPKNLLCRITVELL